MTKLTDAGFTEVDSTIYPRIVASIWGHDSRGKTHFALTAPGPTVVFNLDVGLEGVVNKFANDKKIHQLQLIVPRDGDKCKEEATELWNKFNSTYDIALKEARTVIIDTATELWALLRIARFGKVTEVMPYQYTPVNAEMSSVVKRALFGTTTTNVIFVHRAREIYKNNKGTGEYEQSGFSGMKYDAQLRAKMLRWDPNPDEDRNSVEFGVYIEKCRLNAALDGQTFTGTMATFPVVAQMAIAGTKAEDWK